MPGCVATTAHCLSPTGITMRSREENLHANNSIYEEKRRIVYLPPGLSDFYTDRIVVFDNGIVIAVVFYCAVCAV